MSVLTTTQTSEAGEAWIPDETFGDRLLLIRRRLDLTCEEAGARSGIPSPTWNSWENGASPRKMGDRVEQIASAFNVDAVWLMWGLRSRCDWLGDQSATRPDDEPTDR